MKGRIYLIVFKKLGNLQKENNSNESLFSPTTL